MNQKISVVDLNQKAESYLAQGKLNQADKICNEALKKLEDLALVCNTKGRIVEAMDNQELAQEYYQKAIVINPNFSQAHLNLGNLYSQKKQWNLAIVSYRNAIKFHPDFPWSYQKLGTALMQLKQWDEATNAFRKVVELKPDFPWSYHKLAEALMQLKQWNEAVHSYHKFIELKPDFPWSYHKLAEALMQLKQWNEAVHTYQRAIENNPNSSDLYNNLGNALLELKQWDKAVIAYENAIKLNHKVSNYHQNLGKALTKLKRWDEAIVAYQKSIDINPDNYWYYHNLWEVLLKIKKWDEVAIVYKSALEINANAYWYYYQLGYVMHKQGFIDEAITYYQKARDFKSDLPWVNKDLGDALLEKGNSEEAIAYYIKAIELQPDFFLAYNKLRSIHSYQLVKLNQKQLDNLINCYQEAMKIKPEFDGHYLNLANILTKQGKAQEASSYYQKVLSIKISKTHPEFISKYGNFTELGKPNFIIIGTIKGGTSSLYFYLTKHPSILPAVEKEMHFFDANFHKGIDWYLSQFPAIPEQQNFVTGEATPNYMYSVEAANKLFSYFPKIKLIAILRNPIERAVSHYYMDKRLGQEQRSFAEVIAAETKILQKMINQSQGNANLLQGKKTRYLGLGLYLSFIQEWMNIFPREQLLILKSEDMYENPEATTKQVFDFLGLPNYQLLEYKNYYPGSYPPINASLRHQLSEFFQPHNQKLEEYLGIKFNWN
ncbi:MAG: tetratricopeptide repeat protein [Okeania sp. SIO3B5]|uniref:tetratricopeptide repeat-containing sulfotransferase family protein n=1 Tax=Okeania sp. SIO3B5 TaxID=2607811 RepID=UPI0013FEEFBB|nr:tetratricopeptide repeat-containing sulfotransferase family protein [Okeania sp. SIO3B5]NEO53070.1 tetratricopeptide repeat protein [Okeania sp. SIO3B5]